MYSARHNILVLSLVAIVSTIGTAQITRNRIKDDAYGAGWNGDRYYAPSRDAIYDVLNTMTPLADPNFTGIAAVDPNDGDVYYHDTGGSFSSFPTSAWWRTRTADANAADWMDAMALGIVDANHIGAEGDGVTDDTTALQNAVTRAGSYGTVYLPPGTYLFSQLTFPYAVTIRGAPTIRSRWNTSGAAVTLKADGTQDPAILIGGTADSIVTESSRNIAEGIRLENLFIEPNNTADRGILVDGSDTLDPNRGPARDIEFINVHVEGFTDHNIEFLGNVFDVRWKGGSSSYAGSTGLITTDANSLGSDGPGQIKLYDVYAYGSSTGPQWAMDGRFQVYGGGIAYGSGWKMASYSALYGTHVESNAAAGTIGLQVVGQDCHIMTPIIQTYETGLKIGDGTAGAARGYVIDTCVSGSTTGLLVTASGDRTGVGRLRFTSCTTDVNDLRSASDGVHGSLVWLNAPRGATVPTSGTYVRGHTQWNNSVSNGQAIGYRCLAGGTPGYWVDLGTYPGTTNYSTDATLSAVQRGYRYGNSGAGGIVTLTLPSGVGGDRRHFTNLTTYALHVDPDGGDLIHPGAAGKYLSLDTKGASVTLQCIYTGQWFITSDSGTISHEP